MMERLLMLRVQARGCTVEASVNDIPLGRASAATGPLCLPVHEYVVEGGNEVALTIEPGPPGVTRGTAPRVAEGLVAASLRLLLPRIGRVGTEEQARTVGELSWSVPDGTVFDAPLRVEEQVVLPITFPPWRWLQLPAIEDVPAQRGTVAAFLHRIAADMMRGEFQSVLAGSRLRLEELALAYRQPVAEVAQRLAAQLGALHAARQLRLLVPAEDQLLLRPCAHGRLIECLDAGGAAALRTAGSPQQPSFEWPMRLAVANGRCHVFR